MIKYKQTIVGLIIALVAGAAFAQHTEEQDLEAARKDDLDARLELLGDSERRFAEEYALPAVKARQAAFDRAVTLMRSRKAKAFDLDASRVRNTKRSSET